jgi:hypothetical protein
MDDEIKRLESLLAKIQLLDPPFRESAEGKDLYQEICKLALEDQLYIRLWLERTLNQLEHLFQTEKPNEELFESELSEICRRTRIVKEVNDFFFTIVDPNATGETLCKLLAKFEVLPQDFDQRLESSGRLQEIRIQDMSISEKVELFLDFLRDDLSIDLTGKEAFKEIVASLKSREVVGATNALLIKDTGKAITILLHIKLQPGTGQVSCQIRGSEDFRDAVVRAHSAMRERGFLSGSEDIFYTLDLTDVRYQGSSLAVAAAVAMHDVKLNLVNDPYTAFTGDINLDGQEWTIKPVRCGPENRGSTIFWLSTRIYSPIELCRGSRSDWR